jgi:hypothetical protein
MVVVGASLHAQEDLAKKPVTTRKDKVGQLLDQWWKEGTAAGNVGDVYDNRDGAHSDLNTAPFPQLTRYAYSDDDIKQRRHWAAARVLRPQVTFGNSSTSASPTFGGSNIRMYYTRTAGIAFLHEQYTKNNLYIYPEHRDHDVGHNGPSEGFGDLYPTNTPYLIASQGSSGSDQPFMRAVPTTLAAFRPDVKKKLVESGLLMPTIQYLLRSTSKHVKSPDDYLTGRAHPSVFEGDAVDELKMMQAAHDLSLDKLPPLAQIAVLEEEEPKLGVDYFEPTDSKVTEKLADTPCVVARIWRGKQPTRRMVLSAEKSFDVNKHPLTFHWIVLRGDPKRIQIKKLDDAGAKIELTLRHHERMPIAPGSAMESNRVDIGVFVHNGHHYSPPAFVTWYSLDSETRTHAAGGRVLAIDYGMGENRMNVTNWSGLLEKLQTDAEARKILALPEDFAKAIPETLAALKKREAALYAVKAAQKAAQDAKKAAESDEEKKAADTKLAQLAKELQAATKAVQDVPLQKVGSATWKETIEQGLKAHLALHSKGEHPTARLLSGKSAGTHLAQQWPGLVQHVFLANYVDQRLSVPKAWRDVYRYDDAGQCIGWERIAGTQREAFTADGLLIVKQDKAGRPTLVRAVRYEADPLTPGGVWKPLKQVATNEAWRVDYAGLEDQVGKRVPSEDR